MKISNPGTVFSLIAVAVPLGLASRDMLPLTPWVGWMLLAMTMLYVLMAAEFALGTPVMSRWSTWAWNRREARREVKKTADRSSYDAAVEASIEVTRAYVRERERNRRASVLG